MGDGYAWGDGPRRYDPSLRHYVPLESESDVEKVTGDVSRGPVCAETGSGGWDGRKKDREGSLSGSR